MTNFSSRFRNALDALRGKLATVDELQLQAVELQEQVNMANMFTADAETERDMLVLEKEGLQDEVERLNAANAAMDVSGDFLEELEDLAGIVDEEEEVLEEEAPVEEGLPIVYDDVEDDELVEEMVEVEVEVEVDMPTEMFADELEELEVPVEVAIEVEVDAEEEA